MNSNNYQETPPSRHQSRWAEQFWRYEAKSDGDAIILPDGRSDVMFKFRQQYGVAISIEPIITAPAISPYVIEFDEGDNWVGVRLNPAQTERLTNAVPNLSLGGIVRGDAAIEILFPISQKRHDQARVDELATMLDQFVESLPDASPPAGVRRTIDLLHLTGGQVAASMLAQSVDVSERHLRRTFNQTVGMSLKDYAQIVRFHRALRMLSNSKINAAEVAYECGYSDQAHMARSFKKFGGFSPSKIPDNISLPGLPI